MDALFKNDFSNIIEFTEDNSDNQINTIINNMLQITFLQKGKRYLIV